MIIFIIGCKKDRQHYYISPLVKDIGFYQSQSYWLFKNEVSQKIDCTYVNKDPNIYTEGTGENTEEPLIDKIIIEFKSNIYSSSSLEGQQIIGFMTPQVACIAFNGQATLGQKSTYPYLYVEKFDSLTINGKTFHPVYHTKYSILMNDTQLDTLTYDFFLSPHVGPVKIKIKHGISDTTYSLLKYNVIQ